MRKNTSTHRNYVLTFPSDLEIKQVVRFLNAVSGMPRTRAALVFEVWSDPRGLTFRLRAPLAQARYVVDQLRVLVGVRVSPEATAPNHEWTQIVELGTKKLDRTLRVLEPEAVAASILASIRPGVGQVLLQWVVIPAAPEAPPAQHPAVSARGTHLVLAGDDAIPGRDTVKDQRDKLSEPNWLGVLRVAVRSDTEEHVASLFSAVRAVLRSVRTPANSFYPRLVPQSVLRRRIAAGSALWFFPVQLSATELASLAAWPMGRPNINGIPQSRTSHRPATEAIARSGLVVARSNFPGAERPLALTARTVTTHLHVVGPTETGKTTLLANLVRQAMEAGGAVCLIEPKGDLFRAALDAVPDNRIDDVIVLDIGDARPVGYNVLAEGNPRVAVDDLSQLFEALYPDMRRGVWARAALHRGLSTLITRPENTFIDLVPLLSAASRNDTETAWRNELIASIKDPELKRFWERFGALPLAQQENYAAPVLDRIWQLQERVEIRNIIGQSKSAFTMRDVLGHKKILLVNLARLGQTTASLTGTILLNSLWSAVLSGAVKGPQPALLVLDEFQSFVNLPVEPEEWLAKARSMGLAVVAAHQHLAQLPPDVRTAILSNARSKVVYQTSADDGRAFAREFGRSVTEEDFMNLGRFEVLMKLASEDGVSGPVTATTYPPAPPTGNAAAVQHRSRMRYGRPLAEIEAEISARRTPKQQPPKTTRPTIGSQTWE